MKKLNRLLSKFDLRLVSKARYDQLTAYASEYRDFEFAAMLDKKHLDQIFKNLDSSKSQLRQDLFVLSELDFKHSGFFVEFGATDGLHLSNTYLLEKEFGWKGILAEPARVFHRELRMNRTVAVETDCVWSSTGEKLSFNEATGNSQSGTLSTIDVFSGSDGHKKKRNGGLKYEVQSISLNDLLEKYSAPPNIDYLSIDTEGSELEILRAFDFDLFDIKVITCEHNYTPMRTEIFDLLTRNGYERKFSEVSLFDDWYVRS